MTVLSIVLAILLMTLMLASTQFSPQILVNLRLMRALSNPVIRGRLLERGNRVIDACAGQIQEFDLKRLRARLALLSNSNCCDSTGRSTTPDRQGIGFCRGSLWNPYTGGRVSASKLYMTPR